MSDQNQNLSYQDLQARIEQIKKTLQEVEDMESRQQGVVDETIANARAEADRIIAEANANAEAIREQAREQGRKGVIEEKERVESERNALKSEVEALRAEKEDMLSQLGNLSTRLQKTLSGAKPVEAAAVPNEPASVPEEPTPAPAEPAPAEPVPTTEPAPAEPVPSTEPTPEPVAETPAPAIPAAAAAVPVAAATAAAATTAAAVSAEPAPVSAEPVKAAPAAEPVTGVHATEKPKKKKKKHRGLKAFLWILFILAVLAGVAFGFFVGITKVSDDAMADVAGKGDYVFYYKMDKDPDDGDVILIKDRNGDKRLRYAAATEGGVVDLDAETNALYVDDELAVEDYQPGSGDTTSYPHTVSDDEVFVLCDNREAASQEGVFPKNAIKGRVLLVFRR